MKSILFNKHMLKAHAAGRKSVTRRQITQDPNINNKQYFNLLRRMSNDRNFLVYFHNDADTLPYNLDSNCAIKVKHTMGDKLYVKESYYLESQYDHLKPSEAVKKSGKVWYAADGIPPAQFGKKRTALFMPRSAARFVITITSVRVERLQDITEEDAEKEGIELTEHNCFKNYLHNCADNEIIGADYLEDPIGSFRSLWKSINGKDAWSANPWVWVYEYE